MSHAHPPPPDGKETRMRRAWLIATESPHLPILLFLAWFGTKHLASGTESVPADLQAAAPSWLIWAWALSLALGAILGIVGLILEQTRIESVGLVWSLFGIFFYMADRHASAATMLLAVMCIIRINALRQARKRATHMTRLIAEVGK